MGETTAGNAAYADLAQLALDLGVQRELPALYTRLRQFVEAQTPLSGMFVSSYDRQTQLRTCEYAFTEGEELDPATLPQMPNTGSPHSLAVETGETMLTQDFQEAMAGKPRINVGLDKDSRLPQSSIVVPMIAQGKILGAIEIQSTKSAAFTPDHVATLKLAAHLAALSVETVRALDTQKRVARESEQRAAQLEAKMRDRVRELATKNRELEAFSFTAAHDLQAPLRAIYSLSEDLLEHELTHSDARVLANARTIHESSKRMAALVENLLKFARTAQGSIRREMVDITSIARPILAELEKQEPQRKTHLVVQDNLFANADPVLIRLLVDNLLRNAWKFTAKSPITTIRVGANIEQGEVVYFVEDKGIGFDEAAAKRIFHAFERLAPAEFEGSGLGLATAHRIIERHGGRIWATAKTGEGATFCFTLAPGPEPAKS